MIPRASVGREAEVFADKEAVGLPISSAPQQPSNVAPALAKERYVLKADIEKFGPTPGCPGCADYTAKGLGTVLTAQRAHNPECRERIGKLLETDDRGSVRLEEHSLRRKKRRQVDADAEASAEQAGGAAQEAATPAAEAPTMMEEEATDPATPPARQQQAGGSATTQGDQVAASSTKRSAEVPAEALKGATANDYADSDIRVVLLAAAAEADAAGAPTSGGAQSSGGAGPSVPGAQTMSDVGSLGPDEGSILLGKARALEKTKLAVTDTYRAKGVDITAAQIASVSTLLLQLG